MPEIHWKQPGFTYNLGSIYWKQKINWKIQGNREYIYKNDLDKTCFQHDMIKR